MHDENLLPADVARIAVFRALQLGDMLCAVPALRALRAAFPKAQITLIGLPWARDFVTRFGYADAFLPFPGFPGLPESQPRLDEIPDFFRRAQAERFDLAIQMHGSGTLTNPLVVALGAKLNAGYFPTIGWCPDSERFLPWPERGPEIHRFVRLLQFLGIPPCGEHLEFPIHAHEMEAYTEVARAHGLTPRNYVCIHPGARLPSRRWPAERFARVGDWLAQQGVQVVITGSEDERGLARTVLDTMRQPALDLTGQTSLGAFAALLRDARMVICNDTGASHIAAAMRTPSVVVCSGADHERWAPLDSERHQVLHHPVICRPCAHVECPFGHPCALAVAPEAVIQRARTLLNKELQHAA